MEKKTTFKFRVGSKVLVGGCKGGIDDGDWGSKNISQWRNIGWQFGGVPEGGVPAIL